MKRVTDFTWPIKQPSITFASSPTYGRRRTFITPGAVSRLPHLWTPAHPEHRTGPFSTLPLLWAPLSPHGPHTAVPPLLDVSAVLLPQWARLPTFTQFSVPAHPYHGIGPISRRFIIRSFLTIPVFFPLCDLIIINSDESQNFVTYICTHTWPTRRFIITHDDPGVLGCSLFTNMRNYKMSVFPIVRVNLCPSVLQNFGSCVDDNKYTVDDIRYEVSKIFLTIKIGPNSWKGGFILTIA